ncbi:MAG: hypothetical protein ACLRFL_01070 [Clostridia bacterium]
MKINISHDVYNISNRVKCIDRDYYVVYDTIKMKYEVHNSSQIGSSYCLTLPYDALDVRALDYINMTRVSNIDDILFRLDRDNVALDSEAKSDAMSKVEEYVEEEMKIESNRYY